MAQMIEECKLNGTAIMGVLIWGRRARFGVRAPRPPRGAQTLHAGLGVHQGRAPGARVWRILKRARSLTARNDREVGIIRVVREPREAD